MNVLKLFIDDASKNVGRILFYFSYIINIIGVKKSWRILENVKKKY